MWLPSLWYFNHLCFRWTKHSFRGMTSMCEEGRSDFSLCFMASKRTPCAYDKYSERLLNTFSAFWPWFFFRSVLLKEAQWLHQKTTVYGCQNNSNVAISIFREKNLQPIHTLFQSNSAITRKLKFGPQRVVEAVASYSTSVCYVCHIFRNWKQRVTCCLLKPS